MKKFLRILGLLAVAASTIFCGITGLFQIFLLSTPFRDNPSEWLRGTAIGVVLIAIPIGLSFLVFHKELKALGENKMGFLRNLFGNKQPAATSASEGSATAAINPFTTDVGIKSGALLFKCPTCPNTISVALQQIDPIIGISVACSSCKNISHVPGIYKSEPKQPGMKITGSVRVPIAKFPDLYFEHPLIQSLIKSGQSDLLFDYGLWAFCGACYHQFPATVLWAFSMTQRAESVAFNARTPDSAIDMNALRDGHCSHCQNKELIVVVSEIPDYVRNVIKSKKG